MAVISSSLLSDHRGSFLKLFSAKLWANSSTNVPHWLSPAVNNKIFNFYLLPNVFTACVFKATLKTSSPRIFMFAVHVFIVRPMTASWNFKWRRWTATITCKAPTSQLKRTEPANQSAPATQRPWCRSLLWHGWAEKGRGRAASEARRCLAWGGGDVELWTLESRAGSCPEASTTGDRAIETNAALLPNNRRLFWDNKATLSTITCDYLVARQLLTSCESNTWNASNDLVRRYRNRTHNLSVPDEHANHRAI